MASGVHGQHGTSAVSRVDRAIESGTGNVTIRYLHQMDVNAMENRI